uniref:Protein tipE n=1 Tax=Anopheles farauti TaxID=69004 RepID=A0A182QXA4_9DIPT
MRSDSSELLLEQQAEELRKKKLLELAAAKKAKNGPPPKRSLRENASFYTTSGLAFLSVTAGASLLFLVPLYVDPAISTLVGDFVERPTMCVTTRREDMTGLFNCSWSSCREGCTSDVFKCTHIYVTFIDDLNFTFPFNATPAELFNLTDIERSDEAILLVNIKGCGYPPTVKCKNFTDLYGFEGAVFPCYYSKQNKTVVMTAYNREDQVNTIIHFFVMPFIVTVVSSVFLCIMHCDCRCKKERRRHRHRHRRPRIENLSTLWFGSKCFVGSSWLGSNYEIQIVAFINFLQPSESRKTVPNANAA